MGASYWLITVGSIAMLAASMALQIRTYSRRRPVHPNLIVLGQAVAFGSMVLFSVSLGRPPEVVEWVLILAVGVACGAAYGGLVRVEQTPAGIVMAYTLPWLVVWGALLLVTQGAAAITGRLPWVVYSLAIFSMTLNLGMNGRVIARYRALRMGGVVAAVLVAPFLAGVLALVPAGAQPARADANGLSCAVDQIPELLRGLLPPEATLVEPNPGQVGQAMTVHAGTDVDGRNQVNIVYHVAIPDTGLAASITDGVVVEVYRDSGQAGAEYGVLTAVRLIGEEDISGLAGPAFRMRIGPQDSSGTEPAYLEYGYTGLAGAAVVNAYARTAPGTTPATSHDAFFASVMAAAGALDPGAVFVLEATGSCSGGAAAVPTNGPGTSGGPTTSAGTTTSGTGVSGIPGLLDGDPIKPGDLTQGLVLADGLLLLGSLGQLLVSSGWRAGPGGTPAQGTPDAAGGVWYEAPGDVGGRAPMNPEEIAYIEYMQREGWTWSGETKGWVAPPGREPTRPIPTPAQGTPDAAGGVWYEAPGDVGGRAPMNPEEIGDIESKQRQGFIWAGETQGWVTPEQSDWNRAMRARQREIERAESARAAAESNQAELQSFGMRPDEPRIGNRAAAESNQAELQSFGMRPDEPRIGNR
jgi:hypothetical protein